MYRSAHSLTNAASGRHGWQLRPVPAPSSRAALRAVPIEAPSPFVHCGGSAPAKLLADIRIALGTAREAIREDFEHDGDGIRAARRHSGLMDALTLHLLRLADQRFFAAASRTQGAQLAVAAVGGYGRGELAPGSDLDVLFLTRDQSSRHAVHSIEFILYTLWDLGLRVGHAVRSIGDCMDLARSDLRTAMSLLDLRFLWGHGPLREAFANRFRAEVGANGAALADALLSDMARRHARFQDLDEPDLKHGQGGLRDLQTMQWMAKLRGEAHGLDHGGYRGSGPPTGRLAPASAARFLWSVRAHLHYLTGRAEDRLVADLQPQIAHRLLCDEPRERRCAATLVQRFHQATGRIAASTTRLAHQMKQPAWRHAITDSRGAA